MEIDRVGELQRAGVVPSGAAPGRQLFMGLRIFTKGPQGETALEPSQISPPNPHGIAADVVLGGYG